MNLLSSLVRHYYKASHLPEYLAPLIDMGLRLYLANIFWRIQIRSDQGAKLGQYVVLVQRCL